MSTSETEGWHKSLFFEWFHVLFPNFLMLSCFSALRVAWLRLLWGRGRTAHGVFSLGWMVNFFMRTGKLPTCHITVVALSSHYVILRSRFFTDVGSQLLWFGGGDGRFCLEVTVQCL